MSGPGIVGTINHETTHTGSGLVHLRIHNISGKEVEASKFDVQFYDKVGDPAGAPDVLEFDSKIKPNDTKHLRESVNLFALPADSKTFKVWPEKIIFEDGSSWANPGGDNPNAAVCTASVR